MNVQQRYLNRSHLAGLLCGLALAIAQLFSPAGVGTAQAATTTCTPDGAMYDCTVTFTYTGAPENWTVPDGVTQVTFDLSGAPGGGRLGGYGGRVVATLAVMPGVTYQIRVGGHGTFGGGYNGGGKGSGRAENGGGASDVRSGAFGLEDRLLVAGGGGGGNEASHVFVAPAGNVYHELQSGNWAAALRAARALRLVL